MASYAPLLANEKHIQWRPDMIYFNNKEVKPSINYYVQQMYGINSGDIYFSSSVDLANSSEAVRRRIVTSAVEDSQSGDLILKLINIMPTATIATIDLDKIRIKENKAKEIILSGPLGSINIKPRYRTCQVANKFTHKLPANSFTIIRIKIE